MLRNKQLSRLLRPLLLLAAILALSQPAAAAYYLVGSWSSDWSCSNGYQFTGEGNTLTLTLKNFNTSQEFKVRQDSSNDNVNSEWIQVTGTNVIASGNNMKLTNVSGNSDVTFTLVFNDEKKVTGLKASFPITVTLFKNNGTEISKKDNAEPNSTFNLSGNFNTNDQLYFTLKSGSTTKNLMPTENVNVSNGTVISNNFSGGSKFVWTGANGEVTAAVTLDADGNCAQVKFTSKEESVDFSVYSLHYQTSSGTWNDDDSANDPKFSADGKLTINSWNSADCEFLFHNGSTWYKEINSNYDTNKIEQSGENFKLKGFTGSDKPVTFILKMNGSTPFLTAQWQEAGKGMPFFPQGITSETGFALEPADNKYYYLIGHSINNEQASPEWQLQAIDENNYYIDFTYNQHNDDNEGTAKCEVSNNNILKIVYYTRDNENSTEVASVTMPDIKKGWKCAGVRMRAKFNSEGNGTFSVVPLQKTTEGWTELSWDNIAEATYLPFISLVGENWTQKAICESNNITIASESDNSGRQKPEGWERAWIQYGEDGQPLLSRDGTKVYYSTQWPPLNNIFMDSQFKDGEKDYDLHINASKLTFESTSISMTGEKWAEELGITIPDSKYTVDNKEIVVSAEEKEKTTYLAYKVEDVWANGKFKIWSGWNGDLLSNGNAEWHKNWNWGHEGQSTDVTDITTQQTVFLGNSYGDMEFSKPTYIQTAYFFLPIDNDASGNPLANQRGYAFLHLERPFAETQIQANSREDKSGGIFYPSVSESALEKDGAGVSDWKISRIVLDLHRSATDYKIDNLWTQDNLNLEPKDFTSYFGSKFTAATYAANYWRDGFAYKASGNYYYTMTVTFKGTKDGKEVLQTVNVRSNPFYVDVAESSLFVAQLVKVVQTTDPEYSKFDYITWTPGAIEEFGYLNDTEYAEKMKDTSSAGWDRWGHRIEKIKKPADVDFYQNSDRAEWTENVLVYARRPWMGENPDEGMKQDGATGVYWKVDYQGKKTWTGTGVETTGGDNVTVYIVGKKKGEVMEPTMVTTLPATFDESNTYDGPLEWIIPGTDIFQHEFKTQLYYKASTDATDITPQEKIGDNFVTLRIPTPRMKPGRYVGWVGNVTGESHDVPTSVTIAAENVKGAVSEGNQSMETEYTNPRVRHLHFTAFMDMPNATPALIKLIPDMADADGFSQDVNEDAGVYGNYWREINCTGDKNFLYLLKGAKLNLKNMAASQFTFIDQDISQWISYDKDNDTFVPIERNLTFDFVRANDGNGLIQFYPRKAHGVTFSIKPDFNAPSVTGSSAYKYFFNSGENDYYEALRLKTLAITAGKSHLIGVAEDGTDNKVELDINTNQAYYMFLSNGDIAYVDNANGGDTNANKLSLQKHKDLTEEATTYMIASAHHGTWWNGMTNISKLNSSYEVDLAHAYIFRVERKVECEGAVSNTPKQEAASAPRRADEATIDDPDVNTDTALHYIAYVGPHTKYKINTGEIQTMIESVDSPLYGVVAGEGFIDMMGNEGRIFSADGRMVYSGASRVNLPAGIYIVTAENANEKVVVR